MTFSDDARAILILTGHLRAKKKSRELGLLNPKQWNRLRLYLEQVGKSPRDLFREEEILRQWADQDRWYRLEDAEKCVKRLQHGAALANAVTQWAKWNIWVMTYLDHDYPWRLKERLSNRSDFSPVLYGVGDRSLLQDGGLAVVGSRKPPAELEGYYLDYTQSLGEAAAAEAVTVISGGARGVDIKAMTGALEKDGNAVGVLTHQLLEKSSSRIYRDYLEGGTLALVSLVDPEINLFKVDRYAYGSAAMQRNKYIYCLSDAAVVIRSDKKGGTWSGAVENLQESWVPLWMKKDSEHDTEAANKIIVEKGAKWFPENKDVNDHLRLSLRQRDIRRATILLTVNLSSDQSNQADPLNFKEWGQFARDLLHKKKTPADLIYEPFGQVLEEEDQGGFSIRRIEGLLNPDRINRLSQEEESWRDAGISILTRGDRNYPRTLKIKLRHDSPPLMFVVGNLELLVSEQKKVAILGLRKNDGKTDLNYAYSFGAALAQKGGVLVSTNHSKIEKEAVKGSLESDGKCVIILPGRLQTLLSVGDYSEYLENQQLVFLSISAPHSKIHPASKQDCDIACALSTAVVVVRSGKEGVIANCVSDWRKREDLPIWIRETDEPIPGNQLIFERGGGCWLPNGEDVETHVQYTDRSVSEWLQQLQGPLYAGE